jgi:hypothetical protein
VNKVTTLPKFVKIQMTFLNMWEFVEVAQPRRPKEALNPRGWWIIYVKVDEIIYVQYQECASVLIIWAPSKINSLFLEREYYYRQNMNYAGVDIPCLHDLEYLPSTIVNHTNNKKSSYIRSSMCYWSNAFNHIKQEWQQYYTLVLTQY